MVGGFYFTLLSTAFTVVGVRKIMPSKKKDLVPANEEEENPTPAKQPSKVKPPFSDRTIFGLGVSAAASGLAAGFASQLGNAVATPLTALFMLTTTLLNFVFGARLPKKFTKVVHPLVTCTALTWTMALAFAKVTGITFVNLLKSYRTKSLSFAAAGAGDVSMEGTKRGCWCCCSPLKKPHLLVTLTDIALSARPRSCVASMSDV